MKTVLLSENENLISEWKNKLQNTKVLTAYDEESLREVTSGNLDEFIIIADYDTIASGINKMLTANTLPKQLIVLEKIPEVLIGKNLILHGVKAYGNTRMLENHFRQMLKTVSSGKVWSYPELTAQLSKLNTLTSEAQSMLHNKLTDKEQEVTLLILEGLTNEAIANKLDITIRTVKAHIGSIFQKLHVNDRLSLVLLLKQ
ncbi:response regulator transcription factor [Sulfurimonas paralvinellae]|uniref:Response regulator transcription factor n=1 Tax=Sulfurimonas paralvinellae TaxID=317658 RepID=A0A7M1B8K0_9BACT|nr:LuxR C-terminal-related transcriptional regulator [Sulfurimonas paralvinellae]QOP46047.1 response regulator transcription factor [Sulfurimonas paralvinellae]